MSIRTAGAGLGLRAVQSLALIAVFVAVAAAGIQWGTAAAQQLPQYELRHMSDMAGMPLGAQEVNSNVRGSRHTVCVFQQNTAIDADSNGVWEVAPVGAAIPGITLSNVVITNGGGYKSTSDTEPDFTDVRIFTGDGTATGQPESTATAGFGNATCISWVSTDAGDQQISLVWVDGGAQRNASWDTDGDGNGRTVQVNRR